MTPADLIFDWRFDWQSATLLIPMAEFLLELPTVASDAVERSLSTDIAQMNWQVLLSQPHELILRHVNTKN